MINKWTIINYYNINFLLEITSNVEKVGHICTQTVHQSQISDAIFLFR